MWFQVEVPLKPRKQGCFLVTDQILTKIKPELAKLKIGLCHILIKHTTAALSLCENYDPDVRHDANQIFNRLVPEGKGLYKHDTEGPDDMPAHMKCLLTGPQLTIPIKDGRLNLGTWQGIWLLEFRHSENERTVVVTLQGM